MKLSIATVVAQLKQPTTILGIGVLAGVGGGIEAISPGATATENLARFAAGFGAGFGAIHVLMPDNSTPEPAPIATTEKLIDDAVSAITQQRIAAALPQMMGDTRAALAALAQGASPLPVGLGAGANVPALTANALNRSNAPAPIPVLSVTATDPVAAAPANPPTT